MKRNARSLYRAATLAAAAVWAFGASAADQPVAATVSSEFKKPAWLTDFSLGLKEGYDDNVLLVADKKPGMSPQASWITTLSPKLGFNFAPLLGGQNRLQTLSLSYAPDLAIFHGAPSESYQAHKLGNLIKGKSGDFSFLVDNAFLYNDGSSQGAFYAGLDKNRNTYATAVARERREQLQERATVTFQYDLDPFFIRPTASLLFYDFMTETKNVSGYQNYADRADVNGGADLGYTMTSALAITLGYRYGHQYQQAYGFDATRQQSASDYQRLLLGLEGKPWKWLNVKLAGGPDFRDYNANAPVNDYHPTTYYGEALLTATLTPSQTLSFTYKQWRWVSSTGKIPYFDSTFALAYHWNATQQLGLDLGVKYLNSDYTVGSSSKTASSCLRDDAQYTVSAGVSYAFTPHFSATLAYNYDFGRNALDLPPALAATADYRNFNHQLVSLGVQYKF